VSGVKLRSQVANLRYTQLKQGVNKRFGDYSRKADDEAFTLIELTISAALMSIILVGAYMCLSAAISSQKAIEPRAEVMQTARVVMALLSADLRAACPLAKDMEFLGMQRTLGEAEADNLDFATHNYNPKAPGEGDFCEISYFVQAEGESGRLKLLRRRNPTIAPNPLEGGKRELLARGLRGVKFEYFDGYEWYDTWGQAETPTKEKKTTLLAPNLTGMPEAVRITLSFDPDPREKDSPSVSPENLPPPLVFQTVARLNLTAASQSGFSTDAAGSTNSDATTQPTGSQSTGGPNQ
jgi:prepilin-type N-terminal cleavage/methylation domain-containing protein